MRILFCYRRQFPSLGLWPGVLPTVRCASFAFCPPAGPGSLFFAKNNTPSTVLCIPSALYTGKQFRGASVGVQLRPCACKLLALLVVD